MIRRHVNARKLKLSGHKLPTTEPGRKGYGTKLLHPPTGWVASETTLRVSSLALVYSAAVWSRGAHTHTKETSISTDHNRASITRPSGLLKALYTLPYGRPVHRTPSRLMREWLGLGLTLTLYTLPYGRPIHRTPSRSMREGFVPVYPPRSMDSFIQLSEVEQCRALKRAYCFTRQHRIRIRYTLAIMHGNVST